MSSGLPLAVLCFAFSSVLGNHGNLSTRATAPTATDAMGIVLSGGFGGTDTVEVFVPSTGQSCSLPPLPDDRAEHTMDNLHICGGYDSRTSCLHFSSGVWTTSYTLVEERYDHISWWTDQGLMMMGGSQWTDAPETTEIVPTTGGHGGPSFAMKYRTAKACAIPDTTSGSVVVTGGHYTTSKVSRYDLAGHVEDLPQLIQGRKDHGCGSYKRLDGTQVLMVAGGKWGDLELSSVEVLTTDSTAWTEVTRLPRRLYGVRGVTLGNTLYMTGGQDDYPNPRAEVLEWSDEKQEWVEIGKLQKTRYFHSVGTIQLEGEVMDYCG